MAPEIPSAPIVLQHLRWRFLQCPPDPCSEKIMTGGPPSLFEMKFLKPMAMYQHLLKPYGLKRGPLLGLDVGKQFIGVAISDPDLRIAEPFGTWDREKGDEEQLIRQVVSDHKLLGMVVGWPTYKLMRAKNASEVEKFAKKYLLNNSELSHFPFTLWDECFTTKNVEHLFKPLNFGAEEEKCKEDKQDLDMLAAMGILQGFLDFLHCDK